MGSADQAGVFPGEELVDQFSADLLFPEQHLKDLVAEEVFQILYVYFRKDVKAPVRHEAAVGDEAQVLKDLFDDPTLVDEALFRKPFG